MISTVLPDLPSVLKTLRTGKEGLIMRRDRSMPPEQGRPRMNIGVFESPCPRSGSEEQGDDRKGEQQAQYPHPRCREEKAEDHQDRAKDRK